MPDRRREPEYGNDAEIIFLDPEDGVGGPIHRSPSEERPKLRRAQLNADLREEMRRRAEDYSLGYESIGSEPENEDDRFAEFD